MGFQAGFVALLGRPNVGKSTLLNALLGRKIAIATPKPQTTRNAIRGILHTSGAQLILVDTPGIHQAKSRLADHMVKTARAEVRDVDFLWHIIDISHPPRDEDRLVAQICRNAEKPAWLIGNKADLVVAREERLEPYLALAPYERHFVISAQAEWGLDALLRDAWNSLPEGDPYFPEEMVTDQPEDFYVAETIREKLLFLLRDEVPHAVAVVVEERVRRSERLMYVRASIYVERDSQKAIIIGERGKMLRAVGQAARDSLENYFGHPVYLDLWVKVRRRWRDEEDWLRRLGYPAPPKR